MPRQKRKRDDNDDETKHQGGNKRSRNGSAEELNQLKTRIKEMKEALKKKDEVIKKIRKMDEAIKKMDEIIKKKDEQIIEAECLGFLLSRGLPDFPRASITASSPSYGTHSDYGKEIQRVDSSFLMLKDLKLDTTCPSNLWRQVKGSNPPQLPAWSHKSDIQKYCAEVMKDVAGLVRADVIVASEVQLVANKMMRADLMVFKREGRVIGMCEVKKPSQGEQHEIKDLKDNKQLHSQLANYLQIMRDVHGVLTPIGLVSTYEQWAAVWLDSSEALAKTTSFPKNNTKRAKTIVSNRITTSEFEHLYVSKTYHRTDKNLPRFLASVLVKMLHGEIAPVTQLLNIVNGSVPRKFGLITKGNTFDMLWKALPPRMKISYWLPPADTPKYYFIQDFRGRGDARVWLACSRNGNLCVIKLFIQGEKNAWKLEHQLWREVWGVEGVRLETVMKATALIMPFAFHGCVDRATSSVKFKPLQCWCLDDLSLCTVENICSSEAGQVRVDSVAKYCDNPLLAAEEAVTALANAGYAHEDLAWRHVALLPQAAKKGAWTVKPILIDLTRVRTVQESEVESVVSDAMKILNNELQALC
eukprot:gene26205-31655_t